MAVTAYLNVDGITGESTSDRFAGQMECQSASFEESVSVISSLGGGSGVGKPTFSPLVVTKLVDSASPQILVALASGKHFPTATLSLVKTGEKALVWATIVLKSVLFVDQQTSFASGVAVESLKLNYQAIQYSVSSQKPDGSLNPPVEGGWDLLQNKPI